MSESSDTTLSQDYDSPTEVLQLEVLPREPVQRQGRTVGQRNKEGQETPGTAQEKGGFVRGSKGVAKTGRDSMCGVRTDVGEPGEGTAAEGIYQEVLLKEMREQGDRTEEINRGAGQAASGVEADAGARNAGEKWACDERGEKWVGDIEKDAGEGIEVGQGDRSGGVGARLGERDKGGVGAENKEGGEGEVATRDVVEVGHVDDFADGQLNAGDIVGLDAWPQVVQSLVNKALAGSVDAAREIRQGIVEPARAKVNRRRRPSLPPIVVEALRWLPKAISGQLVEAVPNPQPTDSKENV